MHGTNLPKGFSDLEPFLAEWNLASERDRYQKRLSKSLQELRVFYDAIIPRMHDVMRYLQGFPANDVSGLPPEVLNLYHLALSYMEASHPIELNWGGTDLNDAFPASRIIYEKPSCVS
jgi:hypothetical protein